MNDHASAGDTIKDVPQLEGLLSEPTDELVAMMGRLEGDLLFLGVGGKMGPTMAKMAARASEAAGVKRKIYGVARFSNPGLRERLEADGIETIACDALDADQVAKLPKVPNLMYMLGVKFGTSGNEGLTWAANCVAPAIAAHHFRDGRIVAFSTGNVYGLVPFESGGSKETDTLRPVGDYAYTAVGRERVLKYYCQAQNTPTCVLRLNYAVEMRYGVLVDLANKVWNEQPIDVSMGYANCIWQADANAMALRAFEAPSCPMTVLNVAGPEMFRVRDVCETFGRLMDKPVRIEGTEAPDALLNDGTEGRRRLGDIRVPICRVIEWIADWTARGGEKLDKPTHFESRDGKF